MTPQDERLLSAVADVHKTLDRVTLSEKRRTILAELEQFITAQNRRIAITEARLAQRPDLEWLHVRSMGRE